MYGLYAINLLLLVVTIFYSPLLKSENFRGTLNVQISSQVILVGSALTYSLKKHNPLCSERLTDIIQKNHSLLEWIIHWSECGSLHSKRLWFFWIMFIDRSLHNGSCSSSECWVHKDHLWRDLWIMVMIPEMILIVLLES